MLLATIFFIDDIADRIFREAICYFSVSLDVLTQTPEPGYSLSGSYCEIYVHLNVLVRFFCALELTVTQGAIVDPGCLVFHALSPPLF